MRLVVIDDGEESRNSIMARLNDRRVDAFSLPLVEVESMADAIVEARPDCILLDFVLTESHVVRYRSHVLARVLRDRAVDGLREVPIVLYSSAPKFKRFYDRDQTSHELYDYKFDKEEMQADIDGAIGILEGLASAYDVLAAGSRDRNALLAALAQPGSVELDRRIASRFSTGIAYPVFELAGYLIREIIEQPYPIIDQGLLAARLGIGFAESDGLTTLLSRLPEGAQYKGICSQGFQRWWWDVVEQWLDAAAEDRFRRLAATDRVDLLKRVTGIEQLAAESPIREDYGTAFWAVCEGYRRPVDLADAFIASNGSQEPWHDRRYISIDAAVRHIGEDEGVIVDAVDEERFAEVKALLGA